MTENPDYDPYEIEAEDEQPDGGGSSGLEIALLVVLVVVFLGIIAYFALNAIGVFPGAAQITATPISEPTKLPAFIEITAPFSGEVLDISQPVIVSGQGGGLFEGNVVVQALDQDGTVLAGGATTVNAPDAGTGGSGPWSLELMIETSPGSVGLIAAFSNSPQDGSVIASDHIPVTFGEEQFSEPIIAISVPEDGATVDIEEPLQVAGVGAGLFEGSIVVRALDDGGNILAEENITIDTPEATTGAEGPWSVELIIETTPGTTGMITAFSPLPDGGEPDVSDEIEVTYGKAEVLEPFISITRPEDDVIILIDEPVLVEGDGGGLFEGTVIVRAFDEHTGILAEEVTTIDAPDASTGGEGSWSVELAISTEPGTSGKIIAFSPSPVSSDPDAIDAIDVVYGSQGAYIFIASPDDGGRVDIEKPVLVKGMGGGLFEGNVVVRILDQDGNVLAEGATIVDSADAGIGGQGPWSVELNVETTSAESGVINAFSPSPVDGSLMASDSVSVLFGGGAGEGEVKIEDHLWSLTELNGQTLIDGTQITLLFEGDRAIGFAGCNNYGSTYGLTEETIMFGDVESTLMDCPTPEGVMDQESEYFTALDGAATYDLESGQLFFMDQAGDRIMVFDAAVVGTISASEGTTIPADAVITVRLNDVSLADVPAITIGEQTITGVSEFPVPFSVTYDPSIIEDNHTYAVSVRIENPAGDLLFINTSAYQVITRDNPAQVEIVVDPV